MIPLGATKANAVKIAEFFYANIERLGEVTPEEIVDYYEEHDIPLPDNMDEIIKEWRDAKAAEAAGNEAVDEGHAEEDPEKPPPEEDEA